ncbi:probable glutamate receptor [Panulirus ornatus]|uniref:probable glutamate receptor n=1 Tax=Panulirus ornatus TaxID=150431 RepID=UPI003A868A69
MKCFSAPCSVIPFDPLTCYVRPERRVTVARVLEGRVGDRVASAESGGRSVKLAEFLVKAISPSYLYLVIDHEWPGSTAAVRESWRAWVGTVVIPCHSKLDILEAALRATNHLGTTRHAMLFCSSQRTLEIFKMVRERSLESSTLQWVVALEGGDLMPALGHVLREGTQVTLFVRDLADVRHHVVWSSYIDPSDTIQFERRGAWRAEDEDQDDVSLDGWLFPDLNRFYQDFRGRQLVAAVLNNWPFFGLRYLPDGGAVADSGLDVSVLDALSSSLNFTYTVKEPSDGQWGGPQPDGAITGIIGMVASHQAHLAINEITITASRERVVDFTLPYFLESTILVSRAPAPKSRAFAIFYPFSPLVGVLQAGLPVPSYTNRVKLQVFQELAVNRTGHLQIKMLNAIKLQLQGMSQIQIHLNFRSPFGSWQIWGLLAASTGLMGPIVWVVAAVLRSISEHRDKLDLYSLKTKVAHISLQESAFNMYGSLLRQENMIQVNRWSLRILFFLWYIFCNIIYAIYSGTLTAYLAIPSFEQPIDSLNDLLEATQDGYVPLFLVGSSNEFLFKAASSGIFHQVWKAHDPSSSFSYTIDDAMDMINYAPLWQVLEGKRVFVNARLGSLIRATIRGRHKFYLARQTMYPQGYAIVCRSGAPYKRNFEKMLIRMTELGLVDKWTQDQVTKVPRASGSEGHKTRLRAPEAITLHHLQGAFYIMSLGFLLATMVLLGEICGYNCLTCEP